MRSFFHQTSSVTTRAIAGALISLAIPLAAGCGSSSSGPNSSPAGTSSSAVPGASAPSGPGAPHGELKVTATPKFAAPSSSLAVQSGLVQIAYRNIAINPDVVRVKVGSTIRWTNFDSVEHNVTSVGAGPTKFVSGNLSEGQSFEVKLTTPGVIHYVCTIHPATMNGTIEVVQ